MLRFSRNRSRSNGIYSADVASNNSDFFQNIGWLRGKYLKVVEINWDLNRVPVCFTSFFKRVLRKDQSSPDRKKIGCQNQRTGLSLFFFFIFCRSERGVDLQICRAINPNCANKRCKNGENSGEQPLEFMNKRCAFFSAFNKYAIRQLRQKHDPDNYESPPNGFTFFFFKGFIQKHKSPLRIFGGAAS